MITRTIFTLFAVCAISPVYATTIEIYNMTKDPSLILYFQNGGSADHNVNLKGIPVPAKYVQPWADKSLALTKPYVCSYDSIEAQTVWYLIGDKSLPSFNQQNYDNGTAPGNGAPWWVGGFFEFTKMPGASNYWDITNVDQIGLFAGFDDGTQKWGYNLTSNDMIAAIQAKVPDTKKTDVPSPVHKGQNLPPCLVKLTVNGVEYQKLQGPTDDWAYYYTDNITEYLAKVLPSGVKIKLVGDPTITDAKPVPHCGTQMGAFIFEGQFYNGDCPAVDNPPAQLDFAKVVLAITCTQPPKEFKNTSKPVSVYYTSDALSPKTILSGDSTGGVFVHNAINVGTGGGQTTAYEEWVTGTQGDGVGLNWITNNAADTSCFQAMIDSLVRDVIIGFNEGRIPVTKGSTYDAKTSTKVVVPQYVNQWNSVIVANSDSYGMAYADGAGTSKVLYQPAADATVKCYVFGPDDQKVTDYYTPPPQ